MRRQPVNFIVAALLVLAVGTGTAFSEGDNIAVLRVESVDALAADVSRIGKLAGSQLTRDQLLGLLGTGVGLTDFSWLDGSRPLAMIFPPQGMMLGMKGLVTVVPVTDPKAAMDLMSGMLGEPTTDEQGVHTFNVGENQIAVAARDNYLALGQTPALLAQFDIESALISEGLPPGSISLDIHLEPVAPMLLAGIQSGRQIVQQQLTNSLEGEGEQKEDVPPELLIGMVDIYLDLLTDLVNNASRIQFSLDLTENDIVLHERILPRAGSTLDGLIRAQKGGMPELARYLDPGDAAFVTAGQMTYTPPFLEAVKGYIARYITMMDRLVSSVDDLAPVADMFGRTMLVLSETGEIWPECYRGDFAGKWVVDSGNLFNFANVYGIKDPKVCDKMIGMSMEILEELGKLGEDEPFVTVSTGEMRYRGVNVSKQVIKLEILDKLIKSDQKAEAEEVRKIMSFMFGDDGLHSYYGVAGDYMLQATGKDAETVIKTLIDKVKSKKRKRNRMVGVTPDLFSPVEVGPGLYASFDYKKMMTSLVGIAPEDDKEAAKIREFFEAIPEDAAEMTGGVRFESDNLHIEFVMPLEVLRAIGEAAAREKEETATELQSG